MKIEKRVKFLTKLDSEEKTRLVDAVKILNEIQIIMKEQGCNNFTCYGEYTYDFADLAHVIDDLTTFIEIDKIF